MEVVILSPIVYLAYVVVILCANVLICVVTAILTAIQCCMSKRAGGLKKMGPKKIKNVVDPAVKWHEREDCPKK